MARKETVIPEKVIESSIKVEVTCDCCGCEVKNYWYMTSYYNGVNYEYTSPIDLCERHQNYYEMALRKLPHPFKYMKERYDGGCSEDAVKELLEKVIELYEDDY